MSFDDPIVYPAQPGVAHHHTFFGNTAIDAYTTVDNIRARGNATCRGGTINMSGYWTPSMIDTQTGQPIAPRVLLIYYKTGFWMYMNDGSQMMPLPRGLRMIAGDSNRSTPDGVGEFVCLTVATGSQRYPATKSIPTNCQPGDQVWARLQFPQCWDGVNLDSPNHKAHMSYHELNTNPSQWIPSRRYRCPLSHPVVLPSILYQVQYDLPANPASTAKWRLSSDVYDAAQPGGYSMHGDWINGWDTEISDLWAISACAIGATAQLRISATAG